MAVKVSLTVPEYPAAGVKVAFKALGLSKVPPALELQVNPA